VVNDTRTGGTVHRGNRQQQAGRQSLGILDRRLRTATVSRRRVRAWRRGVTMGWARPASSSATRALHASKQAAAGIRGWVCWWDVRDRCRVARVCIPGVESIHSRGCANSQVAHTHACLHIPHRPGIFYPAEQGQDVEADALCTQAIDRTRSRICYHVPLHTTPTRPLTNGTVDRILGHWMPWMQQARAAAGRVADDPVCQVSCHG
jgi:hypothetical protein